MLPDWMTSRNPKPFDDGGASASKNKPKHREYRAKRAISSFLRVIEREALLGESASRPGFLQAVDPRVKLVSIVAMILATSAASSLPALAVSLAAAAALGFGSRADRRVWLGMLIPPMAVTAAIAGPAILNVVTPGPAIVEIMWLGGGGQLLGLTVPDTLTITAPGIVCAARLMLRTAASACWLADLILTTRWPALLSAFRSLRLPRIFTMTLGLMYRYLFTLVRRAEDMRVARESRTIRRERPVEADRHVAAAIGHLFQTARRLADQVYFAMAARGFCGGAVTIERHRMRCRDYCAGAAAICAATAIVIIDRMYGV